MPGLNILYVITQGDLGGAQTYVRDLAASLAGRHQVSVAIGEPGTAQELTKQLAAAAPAVKIYPQRHLVRRISPFHDAAAVLELSRLYRELRPDIVHLNSSKAGAVGSLAALALRTRPAVVYTVHGWVFLEPLGPLRRALYRTVERSAAKNKNALIVLSEPDLATGRALIPPAGQSKLHLIPLGIAPTGRPALTSRQARAKLACGRPETLHRWPFWVGCVANLYPAKGLDTLLYAISRSSRELTDTVFLILGDGPEKTRLWELRRRLNLQNNVLFLGAVPRASELMPAFDLLVLPSRKEGLPYALIEAMQSGVPVLAAAVGGIPSLIADGVNGRLVPPDDPAALAAANASVSILCSRPCA